MSPSEGARPRFDFAVYSADGKLRAILEAKRRFAADAQWARRWRDSTLSQVPRASEAVWILVVPKQVYAWRGGAPTDSPPDYALDAVPLLDPYFKRLRIDASKVDPRVFEEIVGLWLKDLTSGTWTSADRPEGPMPPLDSLRGGEVRSEVTP